MEELIERLKTLEMVADDVTESDLGFETKKIIMDIIAKELIEIRAYLARNCSDKEFNIYYR